MKKLFLIAFVLLSTLTVNAGTITGHQYLITMSYYDGGAFRVDIPNWTKLELEDTVRFESSDPGELVLILDNGKVYRSSTGVIVLTGTEMNESNATAAGIRCGIITPAGEVFVGGLPIPNGPSCGPFCLPLPPDGDGPAAEGDAA